MSTSSDVSIANRTHEELENEKGRLECEKLRAEIAELNFAWWKRPAYFGSIIPIIIAIAGVITGIATGYFEDKRDVVRQQVSNLNKEREELKAKNKELLVAAREIHDMTDAAYIRLKLLNSQIDYGVGHMQGVPPLPDDIDKKIQPLINRASSKEKQFLEDLLLRRELAEMIIGWVKKDLKELEKAVNTLPRSDRLFKFEARLDGVHLAGNKVYSYLDLLKMHDDELIELLSKKPSP